MNWRSFSTLQWALGASIAVHAALLTVRFVDPETFNRVFQDTPLEVVLVNSQTNEPPTRPRPSPKPIWRVVAMPSGVALPALCHPH